MDYQRPSLLNKVHIHPLPSAQSVSTQIYISPEGTSSSLCYLFHFKWSFHLGLKLFS